MGVFDSSDYRQAIRDRLGALKAAGRALNWRKIAAKIPLQYTFLSKCLNDSATHLSEDHLFRVCEFLELLPEEAEFVLLLRARDVSRQPSRKEFLSRQIERLRKQQVVRAEHRAEAEGPMNHEMAYLLDPMAALVHTALFLKDTRESPRRLCPLLGLSESRLKSLLEILEKAGAISLSPDGEQVSGYHQRAQHWARRHPLMRAHQSGMKLQLLERLRGTDEADKESLFVTFTMEPEGFNEVKALLQETLKKIQVISEKGRHKNVYQLSFDFLKVF